MRKLLLAALVMGLSGPALADPMTDALFATGIFEALPEATEIAYSHVRSGTSAPDFQPIAEGHIRLITGRAEDGAQSLSLTIDADGRKREVVDFPASGGNPVLMVFLESTVKSMAALSGGSPFYIRNRIKDALRQGKGLREAQTMYNDAETDVIEITLHPFKDDPNRDRMGAFADLELHIVVSDTVPGHFLELRAGTPDAASWYHEAITLQDPKWRTSP
jgi:hypothetical protein